MLLSKRLNNGEIHCEQLCTNVLTGALTFLWVLGSILLAQVVERVVVRTDARCSYEKTNNVRKMQFLCRKCSEQQSGLQLLGVPDISSVHTVQPMKVLASSHQDSMQLLMQLLMHF